MTENAEATPPTKKSSGKLSLVIWILLALGSIGAGSATPLLLLKPPARSEDPETSAMDGGEHAPVLIPFQEVIVNLNESRLNRYLRLKITLMADPQDELRTREELEKKQQVLKSWLLSYLADKALDDIRGATGQNRMRREIQNHFNAVLFNDGIQRIRNILYEEFNIQ
jgi:flagellar basal body-associated protein FliL